MLAVVSCGVMAEDVVQERFRKALFAEESDQDLAEAVRGYEAVLEGAETPLRTAATALYRLGECHRKLGRTNEAVAAFGRLAREFPGQTNLVRLARQNLVALGKGEPASVVLPSSDMGASGVAESNPAVRKAQADLAEAARIEAVLETARDPGNRSVRDILEAGLPTPELIQQKRRILDLSHQLQDAVGRGLKTDTEEYQRLELQVKVSEKDYARELDQLGQRKKLEAELLRRGAEAQIRALGGAAPTATTARDPEDVEIDRLKALEKDSPDLVFRGPAGGVSPIEEAVSKGQVRVVGHLLDRKVPLSDPIRARPLLQVAAMNGHVGMVDFLLRRGADVNEQDRRGYTALFVAVSRRYEAVVERLLKAKPDLEAVCSSAEMSGKATVLGLAASMGQPAMVKRLVAAEAKVKQPPGVEPLPFRAVKSKSLATLEAVLEAYADPREVFEDRTVLHEAVLAEIREKAVPMIVAKGGLIDARTSGGETPLLWALQRNGPRDDSRREVVASLLKLGANPNLGPETVTPLIAAIGTGSLDLVQLLLEAKADPNLRPPKGTFPIVAALDREDGILEALLRKEAKADPVHLPFLQGADEARPIDLAVDIGALSKIELLLRYHAQADFANGLGFTPLQWMNRGLVYGGNGLRVAVPPGSSARASEEEVRDVLRRAMQPGNPAPFARGVQVTRRSMDAGRSLLLLDGTNRVTAIEALAMFYGWLEPLGRIRDLRPVSRPSDPRLGMRSARVGLSARGFDFPDWERMLIRRWSTTTDRIEEIPLRLSDFSGDNACDRIPLLERFDEIEIPEAVHAKGVSDTYKGSALWPVVTNCIYSARYTFVVAGRTNVLGAGFEDMSIGLNPVSRPSGLCDWLVRVGLPTNVDLSKVVVRRRAFRNQPGWERTFDLSKDRPSASDLFLRDGDVVVVPEGETPNSEGREQPR